MTRKQGILIGCILVGLLTLASYASPHWHLYRMKAAIESRDADAFSEYVDFPALRESFKGQMMAMMSKKMASPEMKDNPFAALGQSMAVALINPLVDAAISPAGVIAMMENETTSLGEASKASMTKPSKPNASKMDYSVAYRSWGKVAVMSKGENAGSFILKRDGIWSWKLAAIELPKEPASGNR